MRATALQMPVWLSVYRELFGNRTKALIHCAVGGKTFIGNLCRRCIGHKHPLGGDKRAGRLIKISAQAAGNAGHGQSPACASLSNAHALQRAVERIGTYLTPDIR